MRELEDEGKVMALAKYAYPLPDKENPLLSFVAVDGLRTKCRFGPLRLRHELTKFLWRYAPEQFAYMAQRTLEIRLIELVRNALKATGHSLVAYAGGVASNVKANMLIQELPEVSGLFIFPHMGDGGLAAGAALWHNFKTYGVSKVRLDNVFLGPDYNKDQIKEALSRYPELKATTLDDLPKRAAELICEGEIIMWFQGRMEYGPRALGGRSILALPGSHEIRDLLNLKLKRRVWYQPFCPTMLEEEAKQVLSNYRGSPNPFMTSAYRVHSSRRNLLQGTMSIDGTCRPQIIPSNVTGKFIDLLTSIKQKTGFGIVLNTSFNLHGEPLVCSPNDALRTFVETEINYLFINDLVVIKPRNINVV